MHLAAQQLLLRAARRAAADGARARPRPARQPARAQGPQLLPHRVLLPVGDQLGRDRVGLPVPLRRHRRRQRVPARLLRHRRAAVVLPTRAACSTSRSARSASATAPRCWPRRRVPRPSAGGTGSRARPSRCAIIFLVIWTTAGTFMLLFIAALQDIPVEVDEAACSTAPRVAAASARSRCRMLRADPLPRADARADRHLAGLRPDLRHDQGRARPRRP